MEKRKKGIHKSEIFFLRNKPDIEISTENKHRMGTE
jgi:hypothetical protein